MEGGQKQIAILSSGIWQLRDAIRQITQLEPVRWRPPFRVPEFGCVAGWGLKHTARRARTLARRSEIGFLALEDGFMTQAALARWSLVLCAAAAGAFAAGCQKAPDVPTPSRVVTRTDKNPVEPPVPIPGVEPAEVSLHIVKNTELEAAIKEQKGKIVVVDFWATWCPPCKKEFPHLVELNRKHGRDGVVCISVSLDEETDRDAALKFLRGQQANFPNFLLNEEPEESQKHWKINSIPAVQVFDRAGQLVKTFDSDDTKHFTYADVNKLVEELLLAKQ